MNIPEYIIIHHSASKDHPALDYEGIKRYHRIHNEWKDIGYHFVVENQPFSEPTIIVGRNPDENGAHCSGMNHKSIGICFVGNFEKRYPDEAQLKVGADFVRWLLSVYNLSTHRVKGHRDFVATKCPGAKFNMQEFKRLIGHI